MAATSLNGLLSWTINRASHLHKTFDDIDIQSLLHCSSLAPESIPNCVQHLSELQAMWHTGDGDIFGSLEWR
jgi:hypothetical protein